MFYEAFREQAVAFAEGGADAVIVETMSSIEECCVAVRAVRENTKLTCVASFSFDPLTNGGYASMMGVYPDVFARQALDAGAHVIASNCGLGSEHMRNIVELIKKEVSDTPIFAMPNAGMPVLKNGETVFSENPEVFAAKAATLIAGGVSIIGGCCGTTPAHIDALKQMVSKAC
jgi:5-methyltetrahydrofolate--homocysteine methyltransferase